MEKSSKKVSTKKQESRKSVENKAVDAVVGDSSGRSYKDSSKPIPVIEVSPEFKAPSKSIDKVDKSSESKKHFKLWPWLVLLPVWTYAAFLFAQAIVFAVAWGLGQVGVVFDAVNPTLLVTVLTSAVYALAVVIVVLVPYKLLKRRTTTVDLGLSDFPRWLDMLMAGLSFVVYIIISAVVVALLTSLFSLELGNNQQLPFDKDGLYGSYQYLLIFITLVLVVPFAEELLFRGYLYGKMRKTAPVWIAILATSMTFGLAHLWAPGSPLQIMVAIDTFVLSIFLCLLREYTGAIWAAFLVHAIKNGLAFYVLFVNPSVVDNIQAAVVSLF